jgi:two-component system sensor histidine kinase CiaH
MFNRLRLKLTLTNVIIVSIIFLIFISGIFIFMQKTVEDQSDQMFSVLSSNLGFKDTSINHNNKKHDEEHNNLQYRYFYVVLNSKNEIIKSTPNIKTKPLKNVIKDLRSSYKEKGQIEIDEEHYSFEKYKINKSPNICIVFVNNHSEYEILGKLLLILVVVGFAGLILAFIGGLFMADRALIPIKEAWKQQKNFVADASHELRTPLTVIETTLDLIMSKGSQSIDSQIKWIENIHTENKRMTKLVNDLLFLARADSEQITLEKSLFPIHSSLMEVYIPFEALAIQKGINLEAFKSPQVDFYGDEAKIKQLTVILIDNAMKHTPRGGFIGLEVLERAAEIEIIVKDTGEGIEKEHLDNIFKRFYRVDKARSRKDGSIGLGLSIADWIVKEHHGDIAVESEKGRGTTFRIILPKVYQNPFDSLTT